MKKIITTLILTCGGIISYGQISIEECYVLARENYPLIQRYDLIELSERYDLSNARKTLLPQLSLSGKATYQTEVTGIPISIPGYEIPKLSKDQYQILAEVTQVIWDGGSTKAAQEALRAQGEVDRSQLEVDMYAVRQRINDLYFGILLLDEQILITELYLEDLGLNYNLVSSSMANGVANQSDVDAVRVEILTARQNKTQLISNRGAYMDMLSIFIGRNLDENTELTKPSAQGVPYTGLPYLRPELQLYNAMEKQAETRRLSIRAANMPQFGLFVQGGYGKPGLNMLQDKFKAFAIGGLRLSWNFGNYYTRRNNLFKVETSLREIGVQKDVFLFNNELQQTQLNHAYFNYRKVMEDDEEIIRIRTSLVRASRAKLENGINTVSDLVRDMIAEQNAKVNKALHEIELLQTIYSIKNLTNQ